MLDRVFSWQSLYGGGIGSELLTSDRIDRELICHGLIVVSRFRIFLLK